MTTTDADDIESRHFRVAVADLNEDQFLSVGQQRVVVFDVGPRSDAATAFPSDFPWGSAGVVTMTIQVHSTDFEIVGDVARRIRVRRVGPSEGRAKFAVVARRSGRCRLIADVAVYGNFLTRLEVEVTVGQEAADLKLVATGRPVDSAAALEPRDITLVIVPASQGFSCTAIGPVHNTVHLPITAAELTAAAGRARQALLQVVRTVSDDRLPFQEAIDIPPHVERGALRLLARAGALLFQQLFFSPESDSDVQEVGEWLRDFAADPRYELTISIVATRMPIPWQMLYMGDVGEDSELDWDLFLGMRHVVEHVPYQQLRGTKDNEVSSAPSLSVGLNLNPTIDEAMQVDLVHRHRLHWDGVQSSRLGLELTPRTTRQQVLASLKDAANSEKLIYFCCHATTSQTRGDPDEIALIMGTLGDRSGFLTVADLELEVPRGARLSARPLVVLNACDSAHLSPQFYDGFVPFFMSRGARGVVGTEAKTPALFGVQWAEAFIERLLDGAAVGSAMLSVRQAFLRNHRNPLGLLYAMYCSSDTRIVPPLRSAHSDTP